MLFRSGYFQYQGDFNPDWQVATVRQASQIGLFSGVDSNADAALTRGQVAQMVLNGLKADMVYFTGTVGTQLTLPDGTTYPAGYVSEYSPRTSSDKQYNTLVGGTTDIDASDRYIIQLGEELYDGDLTERASTDAFERPATTWRYDNETIGTYADEADLTYTEAVRIGDIYNDLGLDKGIPSEDVAIYEDGEPSESQTNSKDWADYDIVKGQTAKIGGNGVLTEVYYDAADETVLIVVTNTYVAKVTAAYDETSTREAYVTLKTDDGFTAPANASGLTYETEDFSKDDIVSYTYSYKTGDKGIQSMELAESITGAMSTYTTTGSVTVAGDKYDASRKSAANVKEYASSVDKGDDVTIYLDPYGCVLYVDADTEVNYAVILNYTENAGDWNNVDKAELLFTDGTKETVEVELAAGTTAAMTDDAFNTAAGTQNLSKYDIVAYTVDSDDVYELTLVGDARVGVTGDTFKLENGKTNFKLSSDNRIDLIGESTPVTCTNADGETIFLIADTSKVATGGKVTYSVYEGIANVPNLIRDTLWSELPECYDEISISGYRQKIYEYVYTRYPDVA